MSRLVTNKTSNKVICTSCGIEKDESQFYLSKIDGQERMKICKSCFLEEIKNGDLLGFFKKYNIPFIKSIWGCYNDDIRLYMSKINSLPQYKDLRWKDSIIDTKDEDNFESSDNAFNEKIINNLKNELESLINKLQKVRENHDFGTYKNLVLAFKEVLGLYKEMTEDKKDKTTINNWNNTFKIDKDGNVKMIGEIIVNKIKEQLNKTGISK